MKEYVKPSFNYIQIRSEEGIACYGSYVNKPPQNWHDIFKNPNISDIWDWLSSFFGGRRWKG